MLPQLKILVKLQQAHKVCAYIYIVQRRLSVELMTSVHNTHSGTVELLERHPSIVEVSAVQDHTIQLNCVIYSNISAVRRVTA